jgi:hypothetical protein
MKKIIRAAVLGGATVAALAVPAAAMASTGPNAQSGLTKMTGQNATTYDDGMFGWVSVNEVHHGKNGQNFDSVTATSTTGLPLANVTPGQTGDIGWNTDFAGISEPQGVLHFTVSADGMSYTGTATYPAG